MENITNDTARERAIEAGWAIVKAYRADPTLNEEEMDLDSLWADEMNVADDAWVEVLGVLGETTARECWESGIVTAQEML